MLSPKSLLEDEGAETGELISRPDRTTLVDQWFVCACVWGVCYQHLLVAEQRKKSYKWNFTQAWLFPLQTFSGTKFHFFFSICVYAHVPGSHD